MNPIYEKLFDTYGCATLKEVGNYDEDAVCALLEQYAPDQSARLALEDAFFDRYLRWSADAFSLGLHLGLSLFHDEVGRLGAQQFQKRFGG